MVGGLALEKRILSSLGHCDGVDLVADVDGLGKGIYYSVFHSISAFCNAGIDIISENSLCNFVLNPVINITTMFLIIFGGIGFIVMLDLGKLIKIAVILTVIVLLVTYLLGK